MKTADGSFHYAYSAQVVVDEKSQVILSSALVQEPTDVNQLLPMIEHTAEGLAGQDRGRTEGAPRRRRLLLEGQHRGHR